MTDETKRIFDAPFAVMGDSTDYTKFNVIIHSRKSPRYCSTVASCIDKKTAIRFARLPELYDALEQAANEFCERCLVIHGYLDEEHSYYDLISNGCVLNAKGCKAFPWLKLLRKVRNGK